MGLFTSISIIVELCAKQGSKLSRKMRTNRSCSPRSPVAGTKPFLKTISDAAVTLIHKKKNHDGEERQEEWGDGGVWQRAIMMGDKCEPLEFSGVIHYDCSGKQMREAPPRSPRAVPCPVV